MLTPSVCDIIDIQNEKIKTMLSEFLRLFKCVNAGDKITCSHCIKPYPANIYVLKMLSAFYICCIYSNSLQKTFTMDTNTMSQDQTVPYEQSDLGLYCLD